MNSVIQELYSAACECVYDAYVTPEDYEEHIVEKALKVIELVEDGEYNKAQAVGFNY